MTQYVDTDTESLLGVLTRGCDERIFLRSQSNSNKYHLNPVEFKDLLQRGSCTCNLLTPDGYDVAVNYMETYDSSSYESKVQNQANRIQATFQSANARFEVVFGPSGSDMMYVPSLYQTMFNPGKEIINIVTCPDELGSGSKPAAEMKYYAGWNQKGEKLELNGNVCKDEIRTKCIYLPARTSSGNVVDRTAQISELVNENKGLPTIVNLVFGSKSGIEDDMSLIDSLQLKFGSDFKRLMFCVDMCQFRTEPSLLHNLISKNVLIMITGSKFYQAPPFCGALLTPQTMATALASCDASVASAYTEIFSSYDFPSPTMSNIAAKLEPFENKGLRARWEIALDEMAKYQALPNEKTSAAIRRWRQVVVGRLAQTDVFEIMPNVDETSASIVSFKVRKGNGDSLSKAECQTLFDKLALNRQTGFQDGYEKVFIGQPVAFPNGGAFIRLAIGSHGVRMLLKDKRYNPHNDLRLIQILEDLAQELFP